KYDGIDPETGNYKVVDANLDGRFNFHDRISIINMGKEYYGGITNNLLYKDLKLSFLWRFAKQSAIKPFTHIQPPGYPYNRPIEDYKLWKSGELHIENSFATQNAYGLNYQSERGIEDASYLQLKT